MLYTLCVRSSPRLKQTPIKRTPMKRNASTLKTTKLPQPKRGLRQRSKKMEKRYREERVPFVKDFLERNPLCQIRWDFGCQLRATQVHEVLPQGRGGNAVPIEGNEENFKSTCGYCHRLLTDNDAEATERGFLR